MYSDVVLGIEHQHFEEILEDHKERNGYARHRARRRRLGEMVARYKKRVEEESGKPFPQEPTSSSGARSARCSAHG